MSNLLKNVKYDNDSVPILSSSEIDNIAEDIIYKFNPESVHKIEMTPIAEITDKLVKKHSLKLITAKLNPETLGFIDMNKYEIYINEDTLPPNDKSNRWRFTLAHELGHFFLHSFLGKFLIQDTDIMFRIFDQPPREQITNWIEWQANTFAGAMLLPKTAFILFIKKRLAEYNFRVNKNQFYLDSQPVNIQNIDDTLDSISKKFAVSKHMARVRLDNLGYIKHSKSIEKDSSDNIFDISKINLEKLLNL